MTAPASGGAANLDPLTAAWQGVLGAEYAAIYGYSLIGVYLQDAGQIEQARSIQQTHRDTRDALLDALTVAGVRPAGPQPTYPPPVRVSDAVSAQSWALHLEEACAANYRYLLLASTLAGIDHVRVTATRTRALTGLAGAAVLAAQWRSVLTPTAATVPFPGEQGS